MMCNCGHNHGCGDSRGALTAGSHLGLSREEGLTLCSTILLHGEGPLPKLTAEEAWP